MANAIGEHAAKLDSLLKLRSIPFGMKLYERRADMEAIPRIRRPKSVHTLDQVVAQARDWAGPWASRQRTWSARCAAPWSGSTAPGEPGVGKHMTGVWFSTLEDASAWAAMRRRGRQVRGPRRGPLASGRLIRPTSPLLPRPAPRCFINGLQWSGYKTDWGVVGGAPTRQLGPR
jgi:hypothetical protein